MVLPAGVNKATGLAAALEELGLSGLNVVAVGDAENDHAFLKSCGCAAAVANALPAVKEACDIVLSRDHGAGVAELIDRIIRDDARLLPPERLGVLVGCARSGAAAYLRAQESLLIAGGSGSGKSRFVTLLTERMIEKGQEFCLIDPEGDYEHLDGAIAIGDEQWPPSIDEAIRLLRRRDLNIVVGTLALDLPARRRFFEGLLPAILELRARTGRPHWLIVDEAHHFLPRIDGEASAALGRDLSGSVLVTVDPKWLPPEVLRGVDLLLAFGAAAPGVVAEFAREAGLGMPDVPNRAPDEGLLWPLRAPGGCCAVEIGAPRQDHERHRGKYALGDVGDARSFYFRDDGAHGTAGRATSPTSSNTHGPCPMRPGKLTARRRLRGLVPGRHPRRGAGAAGGPGSRGPASRAEPEPQADHRCDTRALRDTGPPGLLKPALPEAAARSRGSGQ
jgi:hypothetical protein